MKKLAIALIALFIIAGCGAPEGFGEEGNLEEAFTSQVSTTGNIVTGYRPNNSYAPCATVSGQGLCYFPTSNILSIKAFNGSCSPGNFALLTQAVQQYATDRSGSYSANWNIFNSTATGNHADVAITCTSFGSGTTSTIVNDYVTVTAQQAFPPISGPGNGGWVPEGTLSFNIDIARLAAHGGASPAISIRHAVNHFSDLRLGIASDTTHIASTCSSPVMGSTNCVNTTAERCRTLHFDAGGDPLNYVTSTSFNCPNQ